MFTNIRILLINVVIDLSLLSGHTKSSNTFTTFKVLIYDIYQRLIQISCQLKFAAGMLQLN